VSDHADNCDYWDGLRCNCLPKEPDERKDASGEEQQPQPVVGVANSHQQPYQTRQELS
jgi:hypothetical protein